MVTVFINNLRYCLASICCLTGSQSCTCDACIIFLLFHTLLCHVMLPCRRRRRWRPCASRALCPMKPWWAVLGLLCPSSCPGTSVSDVPLLSSRLSFPSSSNSPDSVFSIHVPGKQAAVDVYVSVMYDVPLPLEILLHCFSSPSMESLASSAETRLPLPSTYVQNNVLFTVKLRSHCRSDLATLYRRDQPNSPTKLYPTRPIKLYSHDLFPNESARVWSSNDRVLINKQNFYPDHTRPLLDQYPITSRTSRALAYSIRYSTFWESKIIV